MQRITMDKEKSDFHIARLKKGGENFEIVIDPDSLIEYKEGKEVAVKDILRAEKVYSDAKDGELASEEKMKEIFGTTDPLEITKIILKEGEIQLTKEYRDKVRERKKNRIISIIHKNGIDPKTKLPHPETRIRLAFDEAKIKIDELKRAEDQIQRILKELQQVLPIRFEKIIAVIEIPATYAPKLYQRVKSYGTIKSEDWLNDGSWTCRLEIPAGLQVELSEELNSKTHGNVKIEMVEEK